MSAILPISVCLLVLNEEENLVRSLPKLGSFAEIIVCDSGSTDNSVALCEAAGAKVHQVIWRGFATNRRELFQKASQPWILWLDADEVLTDALLAEVSLLFDNGPTKTGYWINRMVFFEGRWIQHGEWFPDWVLRLFRADAWEMEQVEVHESIKLKGPSDKLRGLIEHYSFRDWQDLEVRSEKYAALWAKQRVQAAQAPPNWFAIYFRSAARFLKGYILKGGWLDGVSGFRIAVSRAREVRLKYSIWRASSDKA